MKDIERLGWQALTLFMITLIVLSVGSWAEEVDISDSRSLVLDVYADEPAAAEGPFDSELARHPNVYGTHHIGASTAQAQSAVAQGVVDIVEAFGAGRIMHCVNMDV